MRACLSLSGRREHVCSCYTLAVGLYFDTPQLLFTKGRRAHNIVFVFVRRAVSSNLHLSISDCFISAGLESGKNRKEERDAHVTFELGTSSLHTLHFCKNRVFCAARLLGFTPCIRHTTCPARTSGSTQKLSCLRIWERSFNFVLAMRSLVHLCRRWIGRSSIACEVTLR